MGVAKIENPPNFVGGAPAKVYVVKSVRTAGDRQVCMDLCKKIFTAMRL
jgi:hypothetical protein